MTGIHRCVIRYMLITSLPRNTEETFLQDFVVILKRPLQNYYKILKKCFFVTFISEWVITIQVLLWKSPLSKGLISEYCVWPLKYGFLWRLPSGPANNISSLDNIRSNNIYNYEYECKVLNLITKSNMLSVGTTS